MKWISYITNTFSPVTTASKDGSASLLDMSARSFRAMIVAHAFGTLWHECTQII